MSKRTSLPKRVVVGANGAYWRDYDTYYSMCPVSNDNDPVELVAVYVRADVIDTAIRAAVMTALACVKDEKERQKCNDRPEFRDYGYGYGTA